MNKSTLSPETFHSQATKDSQRLDTALAHFHTDWGGQGSAMEIAEGLRNGRDNSRTVETW